MASSVELEALIRQFSGAPRPAVDGLSLAVEAGEVVSLVGPSGCGKSTTLRMIAGLERPDSGAIRIGGKDVVALPPQARDVAMVFQGFALYPHMTARQIMEFPLKMRKVPAAERERAVRDAAELLNITPLLERVPAELSGGEQQRVAMGRAIVRQPQVFLFDEPLSNLDAALRSELRVELKKLLSRLEATALYVTHDQVEAMTLSDRICVLNRGRLEQIDSPRHIYEAPSSMFVARFFGSPPMNLLDVTQQGGVGRAGSVQVPLPPRAAAELTLGFRPEHVRLAIDAGESEALKGTARVSAVEPLGAETHLELDLEGQLFRAKTSGFEAPNVGTTIGFVVRAEELRWFDRKTGLTL
ncbi:MAG TPA: ABC transporter ATP-binding protein [Polyangiaceae bacterium]